MGASRIGRRSSRGGVTTSAWSDQRDLSDFPADSRLSRQPPSLFELRRVKSTRPYAQEGERRLLRPCRSPIPENQTSEEFPSDLHALVVTPSPIPFRMRGFSSRRAGFSFFFSSEWFFSASGWIPVLLRTGRKTGIIPLASPPGCGSIVTDRGQGEIAPGH